MQSKNWTQHHTSKNYITGINKQKHAQGIAVPCDNVCLGFNPVKNWLFSFGISLKTHLSGMNLKRISAPSTSSALESHDFSVSLSFCLNVRTGAARLDFVVTVRLPIRFMFKSSLISLWLSVSVVWFSWKLLSTFQQLEPSQTFFCVCRVWYCVLSSTWALHFNEARQLRKCQGYAENLPEVTCGQNKTTFFFFVFTEIALYK